MIKPGIKVAHDLQMDQSHKALIIWLVHKSRCFPCSKAGLQHGLKIYGWHVIVARVCTPADQIQCSGYVCIPTWSINFYMSSSELGFMTPKTLSLF